MRKSAQLGFNLLLIVFVTAYLFDPESLPGSKIRYFLQSGMSGWKIRRLRASIYESPIVLGRTDAPTRVVEFVDYQCPYCASDHLLLLPLVSTGALSVVVKQFPLPAHPHAAEAAKAAYCAALSGKGVQAHDLLITSEDWESKSDWVGFAKGLAMPDPIRFVACMDSDNARRAVEADLALGEHLGVKGTPTFVIGNRLHNGRLDSTEIRTFSKRFAARSN